jgi:tRNA(Ile)-lysidine synthase
LTEDVVALVRDTIRRHAMLAGGEVVLVAVSGGADSTALLYLLLALAPELGLRLHVLHVDHGLREDSSADAEFVRALGRRLGVPVEATRVSVVRRGSLEEAARIARYAALEGYADRVGAQRIALGHTAEDQAETVLMRLLEGTGVRGLAGIPPVRGRLIRPLIAVRRQALVALLEHAGLEWREDPTNRDLKFLRNRIRHEVLPLLASAHDADVVPVLARVAGRAREMVGALEQVATVELARLAVDQGPQTLALPRAALAALPRPVAAEVLRQAAAKLGSRAPLRAWAHRGLARVLASPPPRRPFRVGGLALEVSGPLVRIGRQPPPSLATRAVPVPGTLVLPEIGRALHARIVPADGYVVPREANRVAFDADRLGDPLVVRSRRTGDRVQPFGAAGERRLKTLFIDAKVPRWERGRQPVVVAADVIIWMAGLRRSAIAPVTAHTRRVLELHLEPLVNGQLRQ